MIISIKRSSRRRRFAVAGGSVLALLGLIVALVVAGTSAAATPSTVGLGTAGNFAVLAGSAITDVPTSSITGNVGVSPLTSNGLSCAEVQGTIYSVDASGPLPCRVTNLGLLTTAKGDFTSAYGDAAGRTPFTTLSAGDNQLGGQTLVAGVYRLGHATTANLIGGVTLSGSASDVWIFQASSDLVFAGSSSVNFSGGAQACNVFWQVGTGATIGTSSNIAGTILAGTSITAATGATITGRLLAAAAVTLDHNTIIRPTCASATGPGAPQPPGRALYCAPNGQAYDLVQGQDKEPPYDALHLVPATIDPVTGSASCSPAVVTTTTATTPTATTTPSTTTTPSAPGTTTTATTTTTPTPTTTPRVTKAVRGAKVVRVKHVAPKPARRQGGFTG